MREWGKRRGPDGVARRRAAAVHIAVGVALKQERSGSQPACPDSFERAVAEVQPTKGGHRSGHGQPHCGLSRPVGAAGWAAR
eukprot:scaffold14068_cov119-Isochrysis_galbana.AAC.5